MRTTYTQTEDGFSLFIDGEKLNPTFTLETGETAVARFCSIAEPFADELLIAQRASNEKRAWNVANYPKGKNWPEFSRFERLFDKVQKLAGIYDS